MAKVDSIGHLAGHSSWESEVFLRFLGEAISFFREVPREAWMDGFFSSV
jgi:hypothetical protein